GHDEETMAAWVQAAQFDFEPFICDEDPSTKPRKPPSQGEGKPKGGGGRRSSGEGPNMVDSFDPVTEVTDKGEEAKLAIDDFGAVAKVEPSQLQKELRALEESFLAFEGGLDMPERQEMWPRLASL